MQHIIVIRTSAGNSFIRASEATIGNRVTRAIKHREAKGETVYHVGCSASCFCDGSDS